MIKFVKNILIKISDYIEYRKMEKLQEKILKEDPFIYK